MSAETGWTWDETLYAGAAEHYDRGRFDYPPGFAAAVRELAGLDGGGRLLDIGCGPGKATRALAPLFDAAVGVDADAGMLAQARMHPDAGGIEWRQLRAEELPAGLGEFRLVCFAQSFHWFDRPRVAATVRDMLDERGAVLLVSAMTHAGRPGDDALPHPRPPRPAIEDLIRQHLGEVRRAGQGLITGDLPEGEDGVFQAAGFGPGTAVDLPDGRVLTRTEQDVVSSVLSLSYAAPHLFGDRLPAFEADLRSLLRSVSPDSVFSEQANDIGLEVWRPA